MSENILFFNGNVKCLDFVFKKKENSNDEERIAPGIFFCDYLIRIFIHLSCFHKL